MAELRCLHAGLNVESSVRRPADIRASMACALSDDQADFMNQDCQEASGADSNISS
jgi:L-rhamnose isomerase